MAEQEAARHLALVECGDEEDQSLMNQLPQRSSRVRVTSAILLGTALLLGSVLALLGARARPGQKGFEEAIEIKTERNEVESGQYNWQIIPLERDLCSTAKDNCAMSKCCKTTGFHCYGWNETFAQCAKTCVSGPQKTCKPLSRTLKLVSDYMEPARSLFCFSVYTKNTGSTKPSYEKELLTRQYDQRVSIFACDAYGVYSDVKVSLGEGLDTVKVEDVNNDWHFAKRKTTGAWVNTGMFIQVWKAIAEAKTYENYDWTVKVDPDAVFVASRLKDRIQWMPRTTSGSFLQNCKYVDYGFFGNLEVFSHLAFSILVANVDECRTTLPWKIGIKNGKYGPMGEDLFAEICMEKNGVDKVEAFDVTTDGACEANRPLDQLKNKKWHSDCKVKTPAMHPFKKPDDYFKCLEQTMAME